MKQLTKGPFSISNNAWSVTKLTCLMNCPRKFWLKYDLKLPEEKKFYLQRGVIFHDGMATWLLDRSKTTTQIVDQITEQFYDAKSKGIPVSSSSYSEEYVLSTIVNAFELLSQKLTKDSDFRLLHYRDAEVDTQTVELPFRIPIVDLETMEPISIGGEYYDLMGFMDLISYTKSGGLCISDHKLISREYNEFTINTDIQLVMYAYAFVYLLKMGCFPDLNIDKVLSHGEINTRFNMCVISGRKYPAKINVEFGNKKVTMPMINANLHTAIQLINNSKNMQFNPNFSSDCMYKCSYQMPCVAMQHGKDISEYLIASKNSDFDKQMKSILDFMDEDLF